SGELTGMCPVRVGGYSERKLAIMDYVRRRHSAPLGIDDLAGVLNLSPSRTAHVVREIFGSTFQDLLREERIRAAAAMLRTTSLPVSEISLQCGMGDVSHFHRAFKKSLGMTPSMYRRIQDDPA
ncbi:MAG: helix-turn-helix transcriptional regulator, partial [Planctomycetes bacterium]|nr:helix-turn-helix transcriptional regulator [Planctomycetota bacterium]